MTEQHFPQLYSNWIICYSEPNQAGIKKWETEYFMPKNYPVLYYYENLPGSQSTTCLSVAYLFKSMELISIKLGADSLNPV